MLYLAKLIVCKSDSAGSAGAIASVGTIAPSSRESQIQELKVKHHLLVCSAINTLYIPRII